MQMVDLLLTGKANVLEELNLKMKVVLEDVFYEEPIEGSLLMRDAFSKGESKNLDFLKQN